jgi:chemotaxis protein MotB
MRRRKRKEEHISRERWLVSYADFITLLFAFFVVLYASSQVDKRKVGRLAMAIQVAFQELGVFDTSNTKIPLSDSEAIPFSSIQSVENLERTLDISRIVQPMKGMLGPPEAGPPLKDVQAELEKALANRELAGNGILRERLRLYTWFFPWRDRSPCGSDRTARRSFANRGPQRQCAYTQRAFRL